MESLKGQLLISSGGLFDPNFRHTVVLIGEHNSEGALGVILNRELDVSVTDAVPALATLVAAGEMLFEGGPVDRLSPVLLADFDTPDRADLLVFETVGFVVGDVPAEVRGHLRRARVYAGYSGWSPGQLEAEIEAGAWLTDAALPDDVFTPEPNLLWSRVVKRLGPEYERLSKMPFDPSMN